MKTIIFLLASVLIGWVNVKLINLPNTNLIFWAMIAVVFDFATGVVKNKFANKQTVNSQGFRKTGLKLLQYLGLIIGGIILNNASEKLEWLSDGLIVFIIYTEVYSIFENLYEVDKTSRVAPFYKWAIRMLSLNIEKLTPKEKSDDTNSKGGFNNTTVVLIAAAISIAAYSCTIVRPGETSTYSKTDTTETKYKPIFVEYKGGTSTTAINYDSLYAAWKKSLPPTQQSNADSLFKVFLKSLKKDTVVVNDPQSKAQLKYWYDEYGKLQMSCTAKDQTLSIMVAEITRLTKEVSNSNKTVVVYKMVWWGWLIIGAALLALLGLLAVVFYFSWLHKKGKW